MSSARTRACAAALALACACGGGSHAKVAAVTLPERTPAAPAATLTIALPQASAPRAAPSAFSAWQPPPKNPPDVNQARAHFAQGIRAYAAGAFAQALTELETAYSYSPHPAVLYNIAVVLEKVGRPDAALDVYERYQKTGLPAARAAEVQRKIDQLRNRRP
jgi:tetratricopeptide (TPR) repeat protein